MDFICFEATTIWTNLETQLRKCVALTLYHADILLPDYTYLVRRVAVVVVNTSLNHR